MAIQYVFRDLDIPTLYADSIQTNTRSQHVLEKVGFTLTHEDKDFKYYRIGRDMNIELKKMETDDEIRGKAYVHWKSWHEAYPGLVDQGYLDAMTLEKCEKMAYSWLDNLIVAKAASSVLSDMVIVVMKPLTPEKSLPCMCWQSITEKVWHKS